MQRAAIAHLTGLQVEQLSPRIPKGLQAQEASFLPETALSRRPAIRAVAGAAGGGCEPGSFDPGGLPRRFGGTTSAIQLGGLPGPLPRP